MLCKNLFPQISRFQIFSRKKYSRNWLKHSKFTKKIPLKYFININIIGNTCGMSVSVIAFASMIAYAQRIVVTIISFYFIIYPILSVIFSINSKCNLLFQFYSMHHGFSQCVVRKNTVAKPQDPLLYGSRFLENSIEIF